MAIEKHSFLQNMFARFQKKEPASPLSPEDTSSSFYVAFSEDAIRGIAEIISTPDPQTGESSLHPGQLIVARDVIRHALSNHPILRREYWGKTLSAADVYELIPKLELNLSAEWLADYRDKFLQE